MRALPAGTLLAVLITALLAQSGVEAARKQKARVNRTMQIGRLLGALKPVPEDVPLAALADAAPPASRPDAQATAPEYLNLGGSAQLNSRLGGSPGPGPWKERWRSPLSGASPVAVLTARDRAVVQAAGRWLLFDLQGKLVSDGYLGGSGVYLDPSPGLFYLMNPSGVLEARRLADGQLSFKTNVVRAGGAGRTLITRSGTRLFNVSVEIPRMAAEPRETEFAWVQMKNIVPPIEVDRTGLLLSAERVEALELKTDGVLSAFGNDVLSVVLHHLLLNVPAALQPLSAIEISGEPVSISADEAGYRYLLTEQGDRRSLSVISPANSRVANLDLGLDFVTMKAPPIIGYDHRIYLVSTIWIACYSPEGRLIWRTETPSSVSGAGVTADHRLLLAAGQNLIQIDAAGKPSTLASLDEPIVGAAVLTHDGDLLLATSGHLHCLSAGAGR